MKTSNSRAWTWNSIVRILLVALIGLCLSKYALATEPIPEASTATGSTASTTVSGIGGVLTKIVCLLQGTVGKSMATIGICVLGIGLFMGKLSWTLALATAIGIGLIFSAGSIVGWISGTATEVCDETGRNQYT